MINKKFWKNRKVLITGHTGFKGSWLSEVLYSLGSRLYGFSLPPISENQIFITNKIKDNFITSKYGDINDYRKLKNFVNKIKPQIIFHLAAQPLVLDSYNDPLGTFKTNIIGTASLCNIVRNVKSVRSLILITSDKCYLNSDQKIRYFRENDSLGGNDPYSASKAGAEIVAHSFLKSYFSFSSINSATARAGNVIGGGDKSKNRIFTDIINSIENKKKLVIRRPNAIRPWQHVLEPISGYIRLAEKLYSKDGDNFCGGWNFGPDKKSIISVKEIIKIVSNFKKIDIKILPHKQRFYESRFLALKISKSKKFLKWKPSLTIKDAVSMTLDWSRAINKKEITLKQIKNYFKI